MIIQDLSGYAYQKSNENNQHPFRASRDSKFLKKPNLIWLCYLNHSNDDMSRNRKFMPIYHYE